MLISLTPISPTVVLWLILRDCQFAYCQVKAYSPIMWSASYMYKVWLQHVLGLASACTRFGFSMYKVWLQHEQGLASACTRFGFSMIKSELDVANLSNSVQIVALQKSEFFFS